MKQLKTYVTNKLITQSDELKQIKFSKFIDTIFPSNLTSILNDINKDEETDSNLISKDLRLNKENYSFLRLSDFFEYEKLNLLRLPQEYKSNPDSISEDVIQGELGDCYFLSAISALAEHPDRIWSLFNYEQKLNGNGYFKVNVYLNGILNVIIVDDYFVIRKDKIEYFDGKPSISCLAFSGINQKTYNIWAIVLEKVWAKVNKSYENIISGNCSEVFEFFTPAPVVSYVHSMNIENLYEKIYESDREEYILCCDISEISNFLEDNDKINVNDRNDGISLSLFHNNNSKINQLKSKGLITNHAYSLIDCEIIDDTNNNKVKLLKIRNPWGRHEWTGDWSDYSSKWTSELRKRLGFYSNNDGSFWISYDDFIKFYTTTHVCMIKNDYFFNSFSLLCKHHHNDFSFKYGFSIVEVVLYEKCNGKSYFLINQLNKRVYKHLLNCQSFENNYLVTYVIRKTKNNFDILGSSIGSNNRHFIEGNDLSAGVYYVYIRLSSSLINKEEDDIHNITLGLYSSSNSISFKIITSTDSSMILNDEVTSEDDNKILSPPTLIDIIKKEATSINSQEKKYFFTNEGESKAYRVCDYSNYKGYGYIYYRNESKSVIKERFYMKNLMNCSIIPFLNQNFLEEEGSSLKFNLQDKKEREILSKLKKEYDFIRNSTDNHFVLIENQENDKENSRNSYTFQVNITPFSEGLLLISKQDDNTVFDYTSKLVLIYPKHILFNENYFINNSDCTVSLIKYQNKDVELYEIHNVHSGGCLFKYKNKTNLDDVLLDLKVKIKISNIVNLKVFSYENLEFPIENGCYFIELFLIPTDISYIFMDVVDYFNEFDYKIEVEYEITKHIKNLY